MNLTHRGLVVLVALSAHGCAQEATHREVPSASSVRPPLVVSHLQGIVERSEAPAVNTVVAMLEVAECLESFKAAHGGYPTSESLESADSRFLQDSPCPGFVLRDAWGHDLYLHLTKCTGEGAAGTCAEFELVSAGSDGMFHPEAWGRAGANVSPGDDIVLTSQGWFRWSPVRLPSIIGRCQPKGTPWPGKD